MSDEHATAERLSSLTSTIIGAAYKVGGTLGQGFLEKVYENALTYELRKTGLVVEQQRALAVWYDGVKVGDCIPDLVVDGLVIVELKAVRGIDDAHRAICIHYLAATRLPVCLLINFARRVEVKRFLGANAPPDMVLRSRAAPPDEPHRVEDSDSRDW